MNELNREQKLVKMMCDWNEKKYDGKETQLLVKIWALYNTECVKHWNQSHRIGLKKRY
jgi:hypothetical protein